MVKLKELGGCGALSRGALGARLGGLNPAPFFGADEVSSPAGLIDVLVVRL